MNSPRNSNYQGGYVPGVSRMNQDIPRSGLSPQGWQQLVASRTGSGVSAPQAAHNLDPFYKAQNENNGGFNGYCSPRQSSPGRYTGLRNQFNGDRGTVQMSMSELGAKRIGNEWYGMDRPGYQAAISQLSTPGVGPSGLSGAARAAHKFNPYYLSQQERQGSPLRGYSNRYQNDLQSGGGLYSGYGMYEGLTGSFPGGTPSEPSDVPLSSAQANVLMSLQQTGEDYPQLSSQTSDYLSENDVRLIARALGIPENGNRTALVAAIKNEVSALSPEAQTQFMGGLSPRSQQFVGGLSAGRQSPSFRTI